MTARRDPAAEGLAADPEEELPRLVTGARGDRPRAARREDHRQIHGGALDLVRRQRGGVERPHVREGAERRRGLDEVPAAADADPHLLPLGEAPPRRIRPGPAERHGRAALAHQLEARAVDGDDLRRLLVRDVGRGSEPHLRRERVEARRLRERVDRLVACDGGVGRAGVRARVRHPARVLGGRVGRIGAAVAAVAAGAAERGEERDPSRHSRSLRPCRAPPQRPAGFSVILEG